MNTIDRNPTVEDVTRLLNLGVEYKIREEQMGEGTLRIFDTYVGGELVASIFTLESLAHVMGMSMSTMDGRYKRARLARWMVPVPSMAGRPMRGFPYKLLDAVIAAIQHPQAFITGDAHGSRVSTPQTRQIGPLTPEYHLNQRYYTYPSLARSFGLSETTVRNKLNRAGLARRFENLGSPPQGGRPKRGIHERHMPEVKLALHDGAKFFTKYDTAMYRAVGAIGQAREEVSRAVVPHTPPAPGSTQAWDSYELAPVHKKPVNTVNPGAVDPSVADLMAEIDQITDKFEVPPLATPADQPPQMLTPEQADKAQREEERANRRAMIGPMRQQLIDDPDEPTAELFADTVYALDLTGDDAKAFIESVKQARLAKQGGV